MGERNKKDAINIINIDNRYMILIHILIILVILGFLDRDRLYMIQSFSDINLTLVRFIMMFLAFISLLIIVANYYIRKSKLLYIANLFYFNFFIEMLFKFFITLDPMSIENNFRFYYSNFIRSTFIILLLIKGNNKKTKITNVTLIYCFLTILAVVVDLSFLGIIKNNLDGLSLIVILINLILLFVILLKIFECKNIMGISICINMLLFVGVDIYELYFANYGVNGLIRNKSILQLFLIFMGVLILILGLAIQGYLIYRNKGKKEEKVQDKMSFIEYNIKEIIFIINEKFIIDYASGNVKDILGYDAMDIIGRRLVDLICNEDREKYRRDMYRGSLDHHVIELGFRKRNNEILESEVKLTNFNNENGGIAGMVLFITPIGRRKEIEELKGKLNEIKEYEEMQKEFYADLTHELRTPVNIMYSSIQLLEYKKVNEGLEEFYNSYNKYGKVMMQNALVMLKLINNLIDTTKVDSGFTKAEFNNYDIVGLIENITMSSIPYLEAKNINLIFDTEFEEHYIKCDPDKIERIMLNLLSNAAKYTENGGNINVDLYFDNYWVTITVRDSGIGIPDNMQKSIFNKFSQVEDRKEKKLGSGIGLSLVKSLVELHNGKIELKSKLGEGSEFIIMLPNETKDGDNNEFEKFTYDNQNNSDLAIEFSDL